MRHYYFRVTSLLLLLLTLVAFGDNLVTNVGQPSNSDPKFIVHGLLCGAWMILLVVQANLVGRGRIALHRRMGLAGVVIAIGVTLSTIWVFYVVWKGWAAMSPEVKANRLLLPGYSLFVALGLLNRRRSEWHKRYIYTGTLLMLDPVLARAYDPLILPFEAALTEPQIEALFIPWFFTVWLAFYASLFAYDRITTGRVHPVSLAGLGWFGASWLAAFYT